MRALFFALSLLARPALAQDDVYEVPAAVAAHAAGALVVVHCLGANFDDAGIGFAYRDRRHVLTTAFRARCRSEAFVRAGELRITASHSIASSELGLALLTLSDPLPESTVPLSADAFVDPGRGEPLVTFTYATDRVAYEAPFGLTRLTVTGEDPTRFDVPWGSAGAPVIDRHGHVLGVCAAPWAGADMVDIDAIEGWLEEAPAEAPTRPRITVSVSEDVGTSFGPGDLLGLGGTLGVTTTFDDVFTLRGDLGAFALVHGSDPSNDPPFGARITTGTYVGLRSSTYFEDGPSLVLSLELGASAGWESIPAAPDGSGAAERFFVRPAARAMARFGPSEVGYELQLDPEDPAQSIHLIHFGWAFE